MAGMEWLPDGRIRVEWEGGSSAELFPWEWRETFTMRFRDMLTYTANKPDKGTTPCEPQAVAPE